jgi:hypothetical protein
MMETERKTFWSYPTPNGGADLTVEQTYVEDYFDDNRKGLFLESQKLVIQECNPAEDEAWIRDNEDEIMSEILNR